MGSTRPIATRNATAHNDVHTDLADALVAALGYEEALDVCRRCCWYGMIPAIEQRRGSAAPAAR
jgi:hypothetical protein